MVDVSMKKLGIVVSSTRPSRIGPKAAEWVKSVAANQGWEVEVFDLAEIGLPFLDEADVPMQGNYTQPHTKEWAAKVAGVDAIAVVTPQYNKSFPATVKNAIDFLYAEWNDKPVTLVGYGWGGAAEATAGLAEVLGHVKANVVDQINLVFNTDLDPAGAMTVSEENADSLRIALTAMATAPVHQQA